VVATIQGNWLSAKRKITKTISQTLKAPIASTSKRRDKRLSDLIMGRRFYATSNSSIVLPRRQADLSLCLFCQIRGTLLGVRLHAL
jgi:hypothetical protein